MQLLDALSAKDRKELERRWAEAAEAERAARTATESQKTVERPVVVVSKGRKLMTCEQFGIILAAQQRARR